nr:hypothetical protein [uncultured Dongia sp.]
MGKLFSIWLVVAALAWGGAAGATHLRLTEAPHRVAVVLDSSYPMAASWDRAKVAIDTLDEARYTEYAAFTDKGPVHGWSDQLNFSRVTPYAPRDDGRLAKVAQAADLANAERIVYVTTAAAPKVPAGWEVLTLR